MTLPKERTSDQQQEWCTVWSADGDAAMVETQSILVLLQCAFLSWFWEHLWFSSVLWSIPSQEEGSKSERCRQLPPQQWIPSGNYRMSFGLISEFSKVYRIKYQYTKSTGSTLTREADLHLSLHFSKSNAADSVPALYKMKEKKQTNTWSFHLMQQRPLIKCPKIKKNLKGSMETK